MQVRSIAIYLPQFHPTPENDEWWGRGFTEWTNVTKARPLYNGHYQPHLPTDLGFYDLRLPEARLAQADLARAHNIHGFCYYHYWFNGRRILERPFNEVLESGQPDFPFMLCWANENWTRVWDGGDQHILLKQDYSYEDDIAHIRYLIPIFKDERYIKVNGKPVFAIYRSTLFPDMEATLRIWREEAAKEGLELYLCRFETYGNAGREYLTPGFDASIDFQPFGNYIREYIKETAVKNEETKSKKRWTDFLNKPVKKEPDNDYGAVLNANGTLIDYKDYVDFVLRNNMPAYKCFPGITPSWDNSARRKEYMFIFKDSNPEDYARWLRHIVDNYPIREPEENFVFINAWNEWAEGNHLEPCRKWGKSYLEVTKKVLDNTTDL